MIRLATVEWRVKQATTALCPTQKSSIGATFDDRSAYRVADWPLLASILGLGARPQIVFVAQEGPAALAGMRAGDTLVSIGEENLPVPGPGQSRSTQFLDRIAFQIGRLPPDRATPFEIMRNGTSLTLQITPVVQCSAQFVLKTNGALNAHSDGVNVAVTARLVDFARNDDELAFILAHELSHVIFRDGTSDRTIGLRARELRADRLGAQLTRCAGYDMVQAVDLLSRLARQDPMSWLGDPAHGSAKARTASILAATNSPCPARTGAY